MDTTNAALAATIRELSEKATAGEWSSDEHGGNFYVWGGGGQGMVADSENEGGWVPLEVVTRMRGTGRGATDEEKQSNAALICVLRNNAIVLAEALELNAKLAEACRMADVYLNALGDSESTQTRRVLLSVLADFRDKETP